MLRLSLRTQAAALIREEYDCPPDTVTPGALVMGVLS